MKEENIPYSFFVEEKEITDTLEMVMEKANVETEKVVQIVYQPQAIFRVRSVNRCTSSMPGNELRNIYILIINYW